jgi:molybdopterin synthase sulfur carrier subunit
MKLRVQYTAQLRTATGRSEEEIELPEGSSLAGLLAYLAARLGPEAATHLVTARGDKQPALLVVINNSSTAAQQAADTILHTGDIVTLLPPIAGG